MLSGQLGGGVMDGLQSQLGGDKDATQRAVTMALPLLFGALAKNSSGEEGAASLHQALARDHDGSVLDNLGGYVRQPDLATGDGILRHALGDRRSGVEAGLSKSSRLDSAATGKLISMLAPLVMGALGRAQRQDGLDKNALAGMLANERREAESTVPQLGGLARLMDADSDGDVSDELADLGKGLLGKLFRR
jgi:hypothetical protein